MRGLKLEDVLAQIDDAVGSTKEASSDVEDTELALKVADDDKDDKDEKDDKDDPKDKFKAMIEAKKEKSKGKSDDDDDEKDDDDDDEDKTATDASILAAIEAAITDVEKTASVEEASPVSDLMKLANDLNEQQFDGLLKKADILAQAIADGVVGRLQDYEKAATDLHSAEVENTLGASSYSVKLAAAQGYQDAHEHMTKVAEDLFVAGYTKTAQLVQHQELFAKAASITDQLIASLPKE
jgi:hypothetical protein